MSYCGKFATILRAKTFEIFMAMLRSSLSYALLGFTFAT